MRESCLTLFRRRSSYGGVVKEISVTEMGCSSAAMQRSTDIQQMAEKDGTLL